MKITIYPEVCCDECNEVIHNHIDCPACGKEYAGTDTYGQIGDRWYYNKDDAPEVIECEACKARFMLLSDPDDYIGDWEWERIDVEIPWYEVNAPKCEQCQKPGVFIGKGLYEMQCPCVEF